MTDTNLGTAKAPLGVGEIISSSFSILFSNFFKVLLLGFVGALIGLIVNSIFLGFGAATGTADPIDLANNFSGVGYVISVLVNMAIYGLVTALLIQLAYDAKLGRSNSIGTYFKAALPAIIPITLLTVVVTLLMGIGAIALIIGALWVYAVFYVMAPVAVIERGGFGSLGRSAALTKEYRWPIVGLFVVMVIITMLIQFASTFVVGLMAALTASAVGIVIVAIFFALLSALGYVITGISSALVYARLREIKEGVDVDQIASVFE